MRGGRVATRSGVTVAMGLVPREGGYWHTTPHPPLEATSLRKDLTAMHRKPRLALVLGDPAGVGPELMARLLGRPETLRPRPAARHRRPPHPRPRRAGRRCHARRRDRARPCGGTARRRPSRAAGHRRHGSGRGADGPGQREGRALGHRQLPAGARPRQGRRRRRPYLRSLQQAGDPLLGAGLRGRAASSRPSTSATAALMPSST